ncbi:SprT family zinc-dependent metalloprotease [Sorangium sp. So ce315]
MSPAPATSTSATQHRKCGLLLVSDQDVPVKLTRGRFRMRRDDAERREVGAATETAEAHMIRWYSAHARPWLAARVERYAGRIRVTPGGLTVRDLGYRWGSCGKGGRLYFHWKTILLPPRLIEYVVVHELVHLREPHHGAMFWQRVERVIPDWAERREALRDVGRTIW